MGKGKSIFGTRHFISAVFMMLALAWLTVCLPYVNEWQATKTAVEKSAGNKGAKSDNSNPLSNTNEERSETGTSFLSEYLHETPVLEQHFILLTSFFKAHPSDIYIAYHPDLIIPPPEV